MDIQGDELKVLRSAKETVDAKVKLAHIGTHTSEIESGLRKTFNELGWVKRFDFSLLGERETPYGKLSFNDGVQSWLNTKLATHARVDSRG